MVGEEHPNTESEVEERQNLKPMEDKESSMTIDVEMSGKEEEKPYACDLCEHKFSKLRFLRDHRRIHKNERPYACDLCDRKFNRLQHLQLHKPVHNCK